MVACGDVERCAHELDMPAHAVRSELEALEQRLGYRLFEEDGETLVLTSAGRKAVSAMELLADQPVETWEPEQQIDEEPSTVASPPHEDAPAFMALRDADKPEPDTQPASSLSSPAALPRGFRPLPSARGNAPDLIVQNIILAADPTIFQHFQEALTAFEQSSPDIGITLRLEPLDETGAAALLAQEKADIAYFHALQGPLGYPSRYAWSERLSLYAAADHPLARKGALTTEDLAEAHHVALGPDNLHSRIAMAALAQLGIEQVECAFASDDLVRLVEKVREGAGYFAAFGPLGRDFGKMPGIARLAFAEALPQIDVRQALREGAKEDGAISALAEYLFR